MIGLPPSEAGAVQDTLAWALPEIADTAVGAPGAPMTGAAGVTLFEAAEAGPLPATLAALTVNVYAVPLVRPLTVVLVVVAGTVTVPPAGLEITV